jgi:hypothetical protein
MLKFGKDIYFYIDADTPAKYTAFIIIFVIARVT